MLIIAARCSSSCVALLLASGETTGTVTSPQELSGDGDTGKSEHLKASKEFYNMGPPQLETGL